MKKSLLATAVLSALVAAAGAQATTIKLSGQVSRMIVIPDDAAGDEVQFVDIGFSGTRFRITGEHDLGNGVKAGFRLEQQILANPSNSVNGATTGASNSGFDPRYQDVYFSGGFGKVAIGKGDSAANGGTEVDLSGTGLIATSNLQDNFGGHLLSVGANGVVDTDGTTQDDTSTAQVYSQFDAFSRTNRLRYDTPSFGGFKLAASYGQGSATDVLIGYNGGFGSTKLAAAVFIADGSDRRADEEIVGGSASLLLGMGLNFTVAYSESDPDGDNNDTQGTFGKIGYKTGIHAVSVDYGLGEGDGREDGETFGLTYTAAPINGVEIFASYRQYDADASDVESIDLISIGSRVKF